MNYFFKIVSLICLLAIFTIACDSTRPGSEPTTETRSIKDAVGKTVEVPLNVERVVSLAPNLTEITYAIGAGDKLVGATTFCTYPEEATKLKRVGDTLKPNIESIVALKPDVVLVSTASQLESFSDVLNERKIAVFVTNPDSLEGVRKGIELLGELFSKEAEAKKLNTQMKNSFELAKSKIGSKEKVFVQIDPSLYTVGKGSFISDLLERIGLESATSDIDSPYPKISKERARVLDPDIIIISANEGNNEPNSVFEESRAVKNKRVLKIDADVLARPGPRLASAAKQIADFVNKSGE